MQRGQLGPEYEHSSMSKRRIKSKQSGLR